MRYQALSVRDGNSSGIMNGSRISLALVVLKCIASLELEFRGTCEGLLHGEDPEVLQLDHAIGLFAADVAVLHSQLALGRRSVLIAREDR